MLIPSNSDHWFDLVEFTYISYFSSTCFILSNIFYNSCSSSPLASTYIFLMFLKLLPGWFFWK
ncbi:hypothetical protein Syun_002816 [Stephania yunnanensis]|uniref:Uncharacterized protein n=1 Tax=Stephania yunnanensis TaxID=152371 RepID=A0AAP0L215_9MAGN